MTAAFGAEWLSRFFPVHAMVQYTTSHVKSTEAPTAFNLQQIFKKTLDVSTKFGKRPNLQTPPLSSRGLAVLWKNTNAQIPAGANMCLPDVADRSPDPRINFLQQLAGASNTTCQIRIHVLLAQVYWHCCNWIPPLKQPTQILKRSTSM